MLSRRLRVGVGIAPADLREESVLQQLSDAERASVVRLALDRIGRNGLYMAALRKQVLGSDFALSGPGAIEHLTRQSRDALVMAGRRIPLETLPARHWGEILRAGIAKPPREDLVVALAEVEWKHRQSSEPPEGEADVVSKIADLLRDARIDDILATDLRYSWRYLQPTGSLVKFLHELRRGQISPLQRRYVEKLWRGFRLTLPEEIEDIGQVLVQRAITQPAARLRALEIFAARFGARPVEPTLEAVGRHVGVTAARVSRVIQKVVDSRGSGTIASPPIAELLAVVGQNALLSIVVVEQKLGIGAGSGHSLATVQRFVEDVLTPVPPAAAVLKTQTRRVLLQEEKALAVGPTSTPGHVALLRLAQRQCRAAGAANLTLLAGSAALSGTPVARDDILKMIDTMGKATWLDRDQGWFVLDDLSDSLVHQRVRKILAVAKRAVSIREIGEVLFNDPRLAEETEGEFSLAPLRILKLAMLTWPGVEEARRGFLVDRSGAPLSDLLSANERKIYNVLSDLGGLASTDSVLRLCGESPVDSIRSLLNLAPFVHHPFPGVCALRGWPVGKTELLAALAQAVAAGKQATAETSADDGQDLR